MAQFDNHVIIKHTSPRARNSRGPRGHWPPDFPNGPPVFEDGGPKGPQIFRTSYIRIYMFGPPDFGSGPHVLKSGGPKGPREKYRVSSPVKEFIWYSLSNEGAGMSFETNV